MPKKIVSSFASISGRGENKPQPMKFSDGWESGPIFDWYNTLGDKSIKLLQIRKDVGKIVPHRFILAHMCDGRVHRFDRRPEQPTHEHKPEHNGMELLFNHAVSSEDTYVPDVNTAFLSEIERLSYCEIELSLDGQVDLLAVLSACYAISIDSTTRDYTFLQHNCFFFSWTVLMVVSRHYLPYKVPQYESLKNRFESRIEPLTSHIVDEAIALFLDLVIDTVTIFRDKLDPSLRGGVIAMAWAMPTELLRFLWRRYFTIRLHLGLRKHLVAGVKKQLQDKVTPVYEAIVAMYTASGSLDSNLWIEEARSGVELDLKAEVAKILWDAILEAISSGFGDITPGQLAEQPKDHRLKFSLLGKQSAQFFAVWTAVLHTGVSAAKGAGQGHRGTLSDAAVFDEAWFAARDAALAPAQDIVKNTNAQVNNQKRANMWAMIWQIWNDAWQEAHAIVQPRALKTVGMVVKEIIDTSGGTVIQEMKESKDRIIQTRISEERKWRHPHLKPSSNMTNAGLQEYMQNIIKTNTLTDGALEGVNSSMTRVWKEARERLRPPAAVLAVTADLEGPELRS